MKPGTSFFTCAGILPASACSFMVKSIAAGEVHCVPITSTSGTRNGGFHQCVPSARSRSRRPCMISVIGITEVLLARMVSGRTCFSISPKIFCFSGMSSSTASTT